MATLASALAMTMSSVGGLAVRLGTIAIVARILSPDMFGLTALALSFVMIVSVIAQLDIRDALIQRPVIGAGHLNWAWILTSVSGIALSGGVVVSAPFLETGFSMPGISHVLAPMAGIVLIQALTVTPEAVLIRAGRAGAVARAQFLGFLLGFAPVAIGGAFAGWGVYSLVMAYLAQHSIVFVSVFAPHFASRTAALSKTRGDSSAPAEKKAARDLLRLSALGAGNRLFTKAGENVDNLVIGAILNATALGIYSRAYNLAGTPVNALLGLTIRSVVFPAYAQLEDRETRLQDAVANSVTAAALLLGPLAALIIVVAPEIVAILLGRQWTLAVFPLQILAPALALRAVPRLAAALGRAKGRLGLIFATNIMMVATLAGLAAIGATLAATNGAALGSACAMLLFWLASMMNCGHLSGARFRVLLSAYIQPLFLTTLFAVGALAGATTARHFELDPLFVVLLAGGTGGLCAGFAILWSPALFLGHWASGQAMTLINALPVRHPVLLRVKQALVGRLSRQ